MATKNRWSIVLGIGVLIGAVALVLDKVFHVDLNAFGLESWRWVVSVVVVLWIIQDMGVKEWRMLPAQLCLLFALLQPGIVALFGQSSLWIEDWLIIAIGFMVSLAFKLIFRK